MSGRAKEAERVLAELDAEGRGTFSSWSGPPLPLARPANAAEASAVLRAARDAGLVVLPIGRGTKVDACALPPRADLALSTERLVGAVLYEPAEGVVTAHAGTSVAELSRLLAADGQRLAPDVPQPEHATLGGAFAAGQGGADRLKRGTWRDAVLGARVLEASGEVTTSGGRLVKNVTGYDLFRLHAGGHGALGLVLELSLRLVPDATDRAWVERDFDSAREAVEALLALWRARLPATRLALRERDDGAWTAAVHVEGRPRALAVALEATRAAFAPDRVVEGAAARERSEAWRDLEGEPTDAGPRWPLVEWFGSPSDAEDALERACGAVREAGLDARVLADPAVSRTVVLCRTPPDADAVRRFARALDAVPADARWLAVPPEVRVELAGPPPLGSALMAKLITAQDPGGVFARGRVHPSL